MQKYDGNRHNSNISNREYRGKVKVPFFSLIIFFFLFASSCFVLVSSPKEMKLLAVLSFFATIIISLFLIPEYYRNHSYTVFIYSVAAILKYVLQPFLFCIRPIYSISRYSASSNAIEIGILLMIVELLFVSFVVLHYSKKLALKNKLLYNGGERTIETRGQVVIGVFAVAVFALMILYPSSTNEISFVMLKADTGARISMRTTSSIDILFRQIVLIGIYSAFVVIASWCKKKYTFFNNRLYVFIALFFGLASTMIIYGEARSSQIYSGFAAYILLSILFPEYKKKIRMILLVLVVAVVALLTVYKTFYAFNYASYTDAISSSNYGLETLTLYADADFGGPISYAAAVDLKATANKFGIVRFVYGFLRSTMGTNLLVKDLGISTTSMVYNLFLTGGTGNTGYLLPITALGFLYFGVLLSPIITCIMYIIAFYLERKIKTSNSPFSIFFVSYCYIRLASCIVFTNINTILSLTSMMILTAGLLYAVNKCFKLKND